MKVLIILGHTRNDSLTGAVAEAYREGALRAGCEVCLLRLADLHFNPDVITVWPQDQAMEEDLRMAQERIKEADHLCIVYPTWWGSMPALLKAFLDRTFTPGFAFYELNYGAYQQMLKGKTAQLITTIDTPVWVYTLIQHAPGKNVIKTATLSLCGIGPIRTKYLGPVNYSKEEDKEKWLEETWKLGYKLKSGFLTPWDKFIRRIRPWIKALRLQFYSLTFLAYWIGALLVKQTKGTLDILLFFLGYWIVFCIAAASVFINEYFDYKTDKENKAFSAFSGGSRVLINKELTTKQLLNGTYSFLAAGAFLTVLSLWISPYPVFPMVAAILISTFLGLGYTTPPMKFSYRTLGEPVVAFTYSFATLLTGFIFQGGDLQNGLPWLLAIPIFLTVLPIIILAGIPDYFADKSADKKTVAVRFGRNTAAKIMMGILGLSVVVPPFLFHTALKGHLPWMVYLAAAHGIYLIVLVNRYLKKEKKPDRVDGLMAMGLLYMVWYGILPLFKLL